VQTVQSVTELGLSADGDLALARRELICGRVDGLWWWLGCHTVDHALGDGW